MDKDFSAKELAELSTGCICPKDWVPVFSKGEYGATGSKFVSPRSHQDDCPEFRDYSASTDYQRSEPEYAEVY